jgi:hypothetical protein
VHHPLKSTWKYLKEKWVVESGREQNGSGLVVKTWWWKCTISSSVDPPPHTRHHTSAARGWGADGQGGVDQLTRSHSQGRPPLFLLPRQQSRLHQYHRTVPLSPFMRYPAHLAAHISTNNSRSKQQNRNQRGPTLLGAAHHCRRQESISGGPTVCNSPLSTTMLPQSQPPFPVPDVV